MSDILIGQHWLANCFAKKPLIPEFQRKQLAIFLQRGFPTRKEERWKYTDMSRLNNAELTYAHHLENNVVPHQFLLDSYSFENDKKITVVFINGQFSSELSFLAALPKEVILCSINEAMTLHVDKIRSYLLQEFDIERFPFAVLNSALMSDGLFLFIPNNCVITTPIHLLFISTQQNKIIISPRNIIVAAENSQVTLVEEYRGDAEHYCTNVVTELYAKQQARIYLNKIQVEHSSATHIANVFVRQAQDSLVNTCYLATGSHLARDDWYVALQERGAECYLHGFYSLDHTGQHIDNHLHVDHLAPRSGSTMMYKGILDKKSRAVFNGKVHVHPDAQQIHAHQANHNLLLSNDAEVDTKPELEIYADDVKCTHGATVGQLDTELLFYLRSRGINQTLALKLLTRAFAGEVFNHIQHQAVRDYFSKRVDQYDE